MITNITVNDKQLTFERATEQEKGNNKNNLMLLFKPVNDGVVLEEGDCRAIRKVINQKRGKSGYISNAETSRYDTDSNLYVLPIRKYEVQVDSSELGLTEEEKLQAFKYFVDNAHLMFSSVPIIELKDEAKIDSNSQGNFINKINEFFENDFLKLAIDWFKLKISGQPQKENESSTAPKISLPRRLGNQIRNHYIRSTLAILLLITAVILFAILPVLVPGLAPALTGVSALLVKGFAVGFHVGLSATAATSILTTVGSLAAVTAPMWVGKLVQLIGFSLKNIANFVSLLTQLYVRKMDKKIPFDDNFLLNIAVSKLPGAAFNLFGVIPLLFGAGKLIEVFGALLSGADVKQKDTSLTWVEEYIEKTADGSVGDILKLLDCSSSTKPNLNEKVQEDTRSSFSKLFKEPAEKIAEKLEIEVGYKKNPQDLIYK